MKQSIPAALLPADNTPLRALPGASAYGLIEKGRYLYLGQTVIAGEPALQVSSMGYDTRSRPTNMSYDSFRACFVW